MQGPTTSGLQSDVEGKPCIAPQEIQGEPLHPGPPAYGPSYYPATAVSVSAFGVQQQPVRRQFNIGARAIIISSGLFITLLFFYDKARYY